jgi:hypothetical protein
MTGVAVVPIGGTAMPEQAPLISVALCTCNGAQYLRAQLDSVLAQQGVAFEVVVVDDASEDATAAILREYATVDARIRCFFNDYNLGPTANFELAMSRCRGDLIAPCDQDDIWRQDKLSRLSAAIGRCDLVYCDSRFIDAQGQASGGRISGNRTMLRGCNPLPFLFANSVSGHAVLLTRALFEHARPFPTDAYHDWWLALCAAGSGGVVYLDEPLVAFRRHTGAHSPVDRHQPGDDREWLEQRHVLMHSYSSTGLRSSVDAQALAQALHRALGQHGSGALMRKIWRLRHALEPATGIAALSALRLQAKLLRKLRRSYGRARVGRDVLR